MLDPYAPIGEELSQPVAVEEFVEPLLPDAPGVAAPRHVPLDEQEVGAVRPAERVLVGVEGGQPAGDAHVGATATVLHVGRLAVEVRPADVDGVLVGVDGAGDGADDTVGDVVGAVGVGNGVGGGHVVFVRGGYPELVGHLGLAGGAVGIELALQDSDEVADRHSGLAIPRSVLADLAGRHELTGVEAFDAADFSSRWERRSRGAVGQRRRAWARWGRRARGRP